MTGCTLHSCDAIAELHSVTALAGRCRLTIPQGIASRRWRRSWRRDIQSEYLFRL